MHVSEEIADVIQRSITRILSNDTSARIYHLFYQEDWSDIMDNATGAPFPIAWLKQNQFDFDLIRCPDTLVDWFENHTCQMIVNKHGQNQPGDEWDIETTFSWIDLGNLFKGVDSTFI